MERESFVFYQSFYKALNKLDATTYKKIMNAICEYGFTGFISTELTDIESVIFELIKPQLDANNKRYENGCKGGNPNFKKGQTNPYYKKDIQEITKTYPEDIQEITKDNQKTQNITNINEPAKIDNSDNLEITKRLPKITTPLPNDNDNVNENVNENDNVNENVACEQKIFFENFEIDNLPTTNSWKTLLQKWVDYREELGCPLVSNAIGPTYQELLHLSGNNIETAKRIVNKSICSGYKGLFALKNEDLQAVDVEEKPIEKELNWKEKDYQNLWIKAKTGIGMYTEKDEQIAKNHYSGISSLLEKLRNMNDEQIKMFKPEFISRLAE